jgi:hypothetical protein
VVYRHSRDLNQIVTPLLIERPLETASGEASLPAKWALNIFVSIPELKRNFLTNHKLIVFPNTARKGTRREMSNLFS